MSTSDQIVQALRDTPMTRDILTRAIGISNVAAGQALAHLKRTGVATQDSHGIWHLLGADPPGWSSNESDRPPGEPVEDDPPETVPADAADAADFAVWTDGACTIARGDVAIALTREEVAAMVAHLRRFGAC